LRASLSATPAEGAPTAAELAEEIKSLKTANHVEAAPQRTGKRSASAEEPVTARIRRRSEAAPAAEPAITPEAAAAQLAVPTPSESSSLTAPAHPAPPMAASPDSGTVEEPTVKPENSYQQRVAASRRQKEYQASLF
jgi:hypothetical protein